MRQKCSLPVSGTLSAVMAGSTLLYVLSTLYSLWAYPMEEYLLYSVIANLLYVLLIVGYVLLAKGCFLGTWKALNQGLVMFTLVLGISYLYSLASHLFQGEGDVGSLLQIFRTLLTLAALGCLWVLTRKNIPFWLPGALLVLRWLLLQIYNILSFPQESLYRILSGLNIQDLVWLALFFTLPLAIKACREPAEEPPLPPEIQEELDYYRNLTGRDILPPQE